MVVLAVLASASLPAPPWLWDPGCSLSHWTKATSNPVPRQTELLSQCWHQRGVRSCCRARGALQGPLGPPAGAPLLNKPGSALPKT